MKKVKFKNGTFGIRKFNMWQPAYVYKDLQSESDFWWQRHGCYFPDCQGTEEEVDRILEQMTDKGEVVK